ncbi:hypothetical protein D7U87_16010 [Stenotrophomonas maltophilia]|jgi:hypothetical protein|uniref:Uncharacterized protein n=1 Tax=Stenotrophomonas muris TaxID=2963283 RepID=A0ABU5MD05_9GAMM|nr:MULTISPECIES: hypothetical protein [Stenotrophomonas]KZE54909.1 hypothetical protein AVW14_06100 [Stenotrophomonas maltophilia]MBA0342193.1 hypothetical protein [Stenotrophomonas maltophilia]MBH1490336.1 hypothetical protein [Stenotrophomonas maltophilia]MBH1550048.1 hypothetical protein [Stenotrophomonas maltophilia]MBH1570532.1 hypothetical protein [Stenotrophomonas maltophilia]
MNTPSHRQDLELGWLRLQRMLQGIEGMALLLCDHHLALANGAPSPLPEAQLERAAQAIACMALNGRRHADTVRQLCEVPVRH